MSHVKTFSPVRLWLVSLGVSHSVSTQAVQKLATRLDSGGTLEEEEIQLVVVYLGRPNANPVMDAELRGIIEQQKMWPIPHTPVPPAPRPSPYPDMTTRPTGPTQRGSGQRQITNAWTNHNTRDPGARTYVPQSNQSDLKFIQTLASRVGGY